MIGVKNIIFLFQLSTAASLATWPTVTSSDSPIFMVMLSATIADQVRTFDVEQYLVEQMSAKRSSKRCPLIDLSGNDTCIDYPSIGYTIPINLRINHPVINTQNIHLLIDQIVQRTSAL